MYSFDVFGTITADSREKGPAFYWFLQNQLQSEEYGCIPRFIRNNFAQLRVNAQQMAERLYKKDGKECISLEHVYQVMEAAAVISHSDLQSLKDLECRLLIETAIGIGQNIAFAERLVRQGKKVIFIADTIYSADVVTQVLKKCSTQFEGIPCYCSADLGKLQKTGSLFWKINQITGIKRKDWIHYSLMPEHCRQARLAGLALGQLQCTGEALHGKECIKDGDYVTERMMELSHAAMQECRDRNGKIGCRTAPVLLAYVEWLLECSEKLGITRLFFVARDGYLLKKLADRLIVQRGLGIKTHYLYGSRKAWRLPSVSEDSCDIAELLRWSHVETVRTYGAFADIFGLTAEELAGFLQLQGIQEDTVISRAALAYSIGKLKTDQKFKKYLVQKNSPARKLLKKYLIQETGTGMESMGSMESMESMESSAFVELAGSGYTQECLANVWRELGAGRMVTFYFKMDRITECKGCRNYVFWPQNMKNSAVIETLCHSSEGQTLGYAEKDGKVVPVLDETEGMALKEYGYDDYIAGILLFADQYARYLKDFLKYGGSVCMVNSCMELIEKKSDQELTLFIENMPFGITGRERMTPRYAQSVNRCPDENQADGDSRQKHDFPVEFIRDHAVLFSVDSFGEHVYAAVKDSRKHLARMTQLEELLNETDTERQIVLAVRDSGLLKELKKKLGDFGIQEDRILAVDLHPGFILG